MCDGSWHSCNRQVHLYETNGNERHRGSDVTAFKIRQLNVAFWTSKMWNLNLFYMLLWNIKLMQLGAFKDPSGRNCVKVCC